MTGVVTVEGVMTRDSDGIVEGGSDVIVRGVYQHYVLLLKFCMCR